MKFPGEAIAEKIFLFAAIASGIVTFAIFGFMFFMSLPLLREGRILDILTGQWAPKSGSYGIYPMILGTFAISSLSVLMAFPLCLGYAGFVNIIGPTAFRRPLRRFVQMMTGIPTVLYGFVGIFLLVPLVREYLRAGSGMCILSASIMLAVLVSPTMILFFSDSFRAVPKSYLDAADGLGATPVQKLLYLVLPVAKKGILMGLVLALGRVLGDTLVSLMLAGNAIAVPGSILDAARSLTAHIALVIASDYESLEFKSIFACGIVLYALTTLVVLSLRLLTSHDGDQ